MNDRKNNFKGDFFSIREHKNESLKGKFEVL
jgi:hypothetical protein